MKLVLGGLVLVVVIVDAGGAWVWFDAHKLETFCASIIPGNPVSTLTSLAIAHGINPHFIRPGVADRERHIWVTYVTAPSALGDTNCAVQYSQESQIIVSASMLYLP